MTTMLDFYRQHGISPVTQDVSDLSAHFQRRAFLYRQLGLWPNSITGKRVLEVGPGTGENALYTASLKPSKYAFVEPNTRGRDALRALLASRCVGDVEVYDVPIEEFRGLYDVVLCEGLLGLCGSDPKVLLDHVAQHVVIGGVLVITCIDAISDCAEVLRRALAQQYIKKGASLQENVEILKPIFAPHLATLKGMTRSAEDWIVDNILNPASIGPTFSIPDALTQLDGRFEVLGCSPRFLMDWRWYKEGKAGNQWAIDSYWAKCHDLYDCTRVREHVHADWRQSEENMELAEECHQIRSHVAEYEKTGVCDDWLRVRMPRIIEHPQWFGRGQQYLSLVRV